MKALVTGATGFIGAHLVDELLRRGADVRAYCRPSSDVSALRARGVDVRIGELDAIDALRSAMRGCDGVYHLAAFVATWTRDEEAAMRVNTAALRTVLDAARTTGVRRVVYTSTVLTYDGGDGLITEDAPPSRRCGTSYVRSKLAAEGIVDAAVRDGLDVVTVHPTRVFGPGRLTGVNALPLMLRGYMRGTWRGRPGNGSAVGNYVFVDDVARGCIVAMQRGARGGHYILGGDNATYAELFESMARAAGRRRVLIGVPRAAVRAFAAVQVLLGRIGLAQPALTPAWVDHFYDDMIVSSRYAECALGYAHTPLDVAMSATAAWLRTKTDGAS